MINLLPPKQKEELLEQWRVRIASILGIVFLSFFLSLFLVLSIVKIYISSDLQSNEVFLQEEEKIISTNQDLETVISNSNIKLASLRSFYKDNPDLTIVFEKIKETMPSGTYLTKFDLNFFKKEQKEVIKISLSGYASNRDVLELFQNNLEAEGLFSSISFTPQSWVEPNEFTVSFELTKL